MAKFLTVFNRSAILLVLVAVTSFEIVRPDNNCSSPTPTTAEGRLRARHFDTLNRPIQPHSNKSLDVRLRLILKKINFDEKEDKLEIHSWFAMYWKDCYSAWDPSLYDNIREIRLPSYLIWKPDIVDFTTNDLSKTFPLIRTIICILHSDGVIMCMPPYNHVVTCSANLRRWPYDTHTCKMMMGSWTHTGEQMNISLLEPGIILSGYNSNREWKLTSMASYNKLVKYDCCPNDTFKWVSFELMLQRHSGTYSSTVIMPALVLMVLTLVTFWMESAETDRLVLASLNLVSHILFLQHLGKILPSNGDQTPLIITFYRDSMLLAAMAFFISAVAPDLTASTMDLPLWASGLSNLVLRNRFGQVFLVQNLDKTNSGAVSETSGGEESTGYSRPSWTVFMSLIDFTCFVVTFLSYSVLLLGYIP